MAVHETGGILVSELFVPSHQDFQPIFDSLFGNLAIAPSLADAKKIAYDNSMHFKCVTFDGDVVDPNGVVSGGQRMRSSGIISSYQ